MMADGPRVSDLQECPGNARDAENMALATATHAAMIVRSRMYDRGIKRARFVVIRDITIPGVLVEGGFLCNILRCPPDRHPRVPRAARRLHLPGGAELPARGGAADVSQFAREDHSRPRPSRSRRPSAAAVGTN